MEPLITAAARHARRRCSSPSESVHGRRRLGICSIWRTPDQDRWALLRRLEISFSQGAEWKALISKYIGTIPLSGDASCARAEHIQRAAAKDTRKQRHDCEGRRGREAQPVGRTNGGCIAASGTGAAVSSGSQSSCRVVSDDVHRIPPSMNPISRCFNTDRAGVPTPSRIRGRPRRGLWAQGRGNGRRH